MLISQGSETGRRFAEIPREQVRDDAMDEQRVATVDEQIELVQLDGLC